MFMSVCLHAYLCTMSVRSASGGLRRALDTLELELLTVVKQEGYGVVHL